MDERDIRLAANRFGKNNAFHEAFLTDLRQRVLAVIRSGQSQNILYSHPEGMAEILIQPSKTKDAHAVVIEETQ